MVKRRDTQLATKADLEEGLQGLDSKIDGLRTELKGDIGGLRTELKDDIGGLKGEINGLKGEFNDLKGNIHRLNISSVNTGDRLMSLEDRLGRRVETIITERLEPFTSRMETLWRESVLNPKALDRQDAMLQGHESRISALEARRAP